MVPLNSVFDTWRVYGILKILRSAHVSNASRQESRYFVVAHVSHPFVILAECMSDKGVNDRFVMQNDNWHEHL